MSTKKAGFMEIEFTHKDNALSTLSGQNIKFWLGFGLHDYEGSIDGFEQAYPIHFAELIEHKIIKKVD